MFLLDFYLRLTSRPGEVQLSWLRSILQHTVVGLLLILSTVRAIHPRYRLFRPATSYCEILSGRLEDLDVFSTRMLGHVHVPVGLTVSVKCSILCISLSRYHITRLPLSRWSRHGHTCLVIPGRDPLNHHRLYGCFVESGTLRQPIF